MIVASIGIASVTLSLSLFGIIMALGRIATAIETLVATRRTEEK